MLFHVVDQVPDAFAGVVAGTFVVDIPKGALNRIGIGAISRQIQQLEAGMRGQPLLDFLGFMELRIIDDDGEVGKERGGMGASERIEEFQEEPRLFTCISYNFI